MKIIADDKIPFLKGALERYADLVYLPGNLITSDILTDADAMLIRTRTKCTANLLEGTSIRFIGTATIGFDHIDTQYCIKNNIKWTNAPGCNSTSVQQYIAAALLKISSEKGFELKDKTLGIVGVGNVGSKVEKFARTMGMNVLLNDPPRARIEGERNFQSLNTILSESDIVTVHVPLIIAGKDFTYHLFNEKSFRKMKQGTWFLNSARGEVTDTFALKNALIQGKLAGTVLDVWENEPNIDLELVQKAFIATPHIAGYSTDGKANGTSMVVNSLCRYFKLSSDHWYPIDVPPAAKPYISIDCSNKSEEDIIREAVIHTYDIDKDHSGFRLSPSDFEKMRGEYPLRREFPSYTVNLKAGTKNVKHILKTIGFKLKV